MDELETVTKVDENRFEIDASVKLSDLEDLIGVSLISENYDSLGGYVIELLDHLPVEGETVNKDGITLKVISMDKNRIDRIAILIDPALQG